MVDTRVTVTTSKEEELRAMNDADTADCDAARSEAGLPPAADDQRCDQCPAAILCGMAVLSE